jgi:Domain of unknown function (DUF4124)
MRWPTMLVLVFVACGAHAETVYKCVGSDGRITYQQTACPRTQKQQTIELQDSEPTAPAVTPVAPPPEAATPVDMPPPPPRRPPPRLFGCIRATDGKPYTSDNGNPQPYQAPYGMLGAGDLPLARSGQNSASAPELNRGKVSPTLIGGNYVWVQDQCRPLSPVEACQALRDDAEENDRKLRNAFQSQRGPFEQRGAELKAKLAGC